MAAESVALPRLPRSRGRRASAKPRVSFQLVFKAVLVLFVGTVASLAFVGRSYYSAPFIERAHHPLYQLLRPPGTIGIALGITGMVMMALIFVYSLRKRSKLLQKIGTQPQWLKVHIFLGFGGPILITFHSTGKLHGLVAIAFYCMWAMVFSGIVGRYLYAKIPRTISGNQMTLKEIEGEVAQIVNLLQESERKNEVLDRLQFFLGRTRKQTGGFLAALGRIVLDDVLRPWNALRVWRIVARDRSMRWRQRLTVSRLVLRQQKLLNKLAVLDAMKSMFSYWHIFHKPFAVITFVIASLHVGVVVYLGYGLRW